MGCELESVKRSLPSSLQLACSAYPSRVKTVFVKYLLVESVPVYRTALPEPNEENQNIYYAFLAKNILLFSLEIF